MRGMGIILIKYFISTYKSLPMIRIIADRPGGGEDLIDGGKK